MCFTELPGIAEVIHKVLEPLSVAGGTPGVHGWETFIRPKSHDSKRHPSTLSGDAAWPVEQLQHFVSLCYRSVAAVPCIHIGDMIHLVGKTIEQRAEKANPVQLAIMPVVVPGGGCMSSPWSKLKMFTNQ